MADPEPRDTVVLVADDDTLVRSVLRMALESLGLTVVESSSMEETRRSAQAHDLRLAVLDVNMPGGTVHEALEALRATHRHLPVLVLSGDHSAHGVLESADCEFARKPIGLDDFLERVERLLDPTHAESRP
jgi:DNA-binding NtrC family response regulator